MVLGPPLIVKEVLGSQAALASAGRLSCDADGATRSCSRARSSQIRRNSPKPLRGFPARSSSSDDESVITMYNARRIASSVTPVSGSGCRIRLDEHEPASVLGPTDGASRVVPPNANLADSEVPAGEERGDACRPGHE